MPPSAGHGRASESHISTRLRIEGWIPDRVMAGYQQAAVHLGADDEGEIIATLIRKDPRALTVAQRFKRRFLALLGRRPAIMYVHGWNDYFYRRHASEYWESLGVPFYAVDLRKYGRSLRKGQTPGYIEDLHEYSREFNALRDVIIAEQGEDARILVIGHSQGGLSAALWVSGEHPRNVEAMTLNSPWLELQGNRMFRILSTPVVQAFQLLGGKTVMPMRDPGFYARCIRRATGGEWDYLEHPLYDPSVFLPCAGWMRAIYDAQDEVAKGLKIRIPVLVCTSDASMLQNVWNEGMRLADCVLDVGAVREAALNLGNFVALATIQGGMHDLTMSRPGARRRYFSIVTRWSSALAWRRGIPAASVRAALARM